MSTARMRFAATTRSPHRQLARWHVRAKPVWRRPGERGMAEHFEITDAMRALIGKESPPWTYEVTTTSVRAFARGVGYTDPVYFDVEAARRAGYRSLPAPPTYLGTPVFIPGKSSDTFSGPTEGM